MKLKNYLLIAIVVSAMTSCSSPENKGKDIGAEYCRCLNSKNISNLNLVQIENFKDSCLKLGNIKYNEIIETYGGNEEKSKIFKLFYNITIDTTLKKIDSIYAVIIEKQLSNFLWTKKGEEDYKNYLLTFKNDTMNLINREGNYLYQIKGNMFVFKNRGENSHGRIKFINLDSFYFSVSDSSEDRIFYKKATAQDSLIGYYLGYSQSGLFENTLKANGDFIDNRSLYSFDLKDNTIIMKYHKTDKIKIKLNIIKLNHLKGFRIILINQNMYRIKSDELNNLEFLFKSRDEN